MAPKPNIFNLLSDLFFVNKIYIQYQGKAHWRAGSWFFRETLIDPPVLSTSGRGLKAQVRRTREAKARAEHGRHSRADGRGAHHGRSTSRAEPNGRSTSRSRRGNACDYLVVEDGGIIVKKEEHKSHRHWGSQFDPSTLQESILIALSLCSVLCVINM